MSGIMTQVLPIGSGLSLLDKEGRYQLFVHTKCKFTIQHLSYQNYSLPYGELFFVSSGFGILNTAADKVLSIG